MPKKMPNPVDKYVGARVRLARLEKDKSQSNLADQLGISFQQIQKYEQGTNRISSSRMTQIVKALDKPVNWFFPDASAKGDGADIVAEMLGAPHGLELARAFLSIEKAKDRHSVLENARTIASLSTAARSARPQAARAA